jgi:murein L,D-transpeptidase YcbB/YkuD
MTPLPHIERRVTEIASGTQVNPARGLGSWGVGIRRVETKRKQLLTSVLQLLPSGSGADLRKDALTDLRKKTSMSVTRMSEDARRAVGPQSRPCGIITILLVLITFASFDLHAASADGPRSQIAAAVASASAILDQSTAAHGGSQALQSVYSGSGHSPLWSRDGTATRQAQALLLELQNAQAYGLEVKDYRGNEIGQFVNAVPSSGASDDERWAQFDVNLSLATLRFIADLHYGRVTPEAAGFKLRKDRPPFDLAAALEGLTSAPRVGLRRAGVLPLRTAQGCAGAVSKTCAAERLRAASATGVWVCG